MKLLILIPFLLFFCIFVFAQDPTLESSPIETSPSDTSVQFSPNDFSCKITSPRYEYRRGAKIDIKMDIQNVSEWNRMICTYDGNDLWDLEIIGPDNQPLKAKMVIVKRKIRKKLGTNDFKNLAKELSFILTIHGVRSLDGKCCVLTKRMNQVEKRYYLCKRGLYQIKAIYNTNTYSGKQFGFNAWTGRIESNVIRLTLN